MQNDSEGWFRIQLGALDQWITLVARPRHFGEVAVIATNLAEIEMNCGKLRKRARIFQPHRSCAQADVRRKPREGG
jgi:hypothetical protein